MTRRAIPAGVSFAAKYEQEWIAEIRAQGREPLKDYKMDRALKSLVYDRSTPTPMQALAAATKAFDKAKARLGMGVYVQDDPPTALARRAARFAQSTPIRMRGAA